MNEFNSYIRKYSSETFEGNINDIPEQQDKIRNILIKYKPKEILEIGFNAGHSSNFFLKNSNANVTSFDIGIHDYTKYGKQFIDLKYPHRHILIYGNSLDTIPHFSQFSDKKFDLIFIDGNHDYNYALNDLINCRRLAHNNTIVILDDTVHSKNVKYTLPHTIGPTRAWNELVKNKQIEQIEIQNFKRGRGHSWGKYNLEDDLFDLTKEYTTHSNCNDKFTLGYMKVYHKYFFPFKKKKLKMLEIGVREGWSHILWANYFTNSTIYGIDNFADPVFNKLEKQYNFNNNKIKIFIGNQEDEEFLNKNINFDLDIIIDDGGHRMDQQQISLGNLFKKLKPGGIYIIEDLHTSDIRSFRDTLTHSSSTKYFLKNLYNLPKSYYLQEDDLKYLRDNINCLKFYCADRVCVIIKNY